MDKLLLFSGLTPRRRSGGENRVPSRQTATRFPEGKQNSVGGGEVLSVSTALPVYLVFNKVDAYTYIEKEEDDLTPATRENLSLEELKKSWIARANTPCIFLSALAKTNLEKFRSDLYGMVREIHAGRYPFNNFLY